MNDSWPQVAYIKWNSKRYYLVDSGIGAGFEDWHLTLGEITNEANPLGDWRHLLSPVYVDNLGVWYHGVPGPAYVLAARPGTDEQTYLTRALTRNEEWTGTWNRAKRARYWPNSIMANPDNALEMLRLSHEEPPMCPGKVPETTELPPGLWLGKCTGGQCLVKCNTAAEEDQCQQTLGPTSQCYRDPSGSPQDQPASPTRSLVPYLEPDEPEWPVGEEYTGYCRVGGGMSAALSTTQDGGVLWQDHGRITRPPDWYRDPSDPKQQDFESPDYGLDCEPNIGDVGSVGNPTAILVKDKQGIQWVLAIFANYGRLIIARARLNDVLGKNPRVPPSQAFHYWGRDGENGTTLRWQTRSTTDPKAKGFAASILPVHANSANTTEYREFNTDGKPGLFVPAVSFFYSEALETYVLVTGVYTDNRWVMRSNFAVHQFTGGSILDAPTDPNVVGGKPAGYYFKTFEAYRNVFGEVKQPKGYEVSRIETQCPSEQRPAYATVLGIPEPNRSDLGASHRQGQRSRVFYTFGNENDGLPANTHYSKYEIRWSKNAEPPLCPITRRCSGNNPPGEQASEEFNAVDLP